MRGKTAAGTQRWYCSICQKSAIRTRIDLRRLHHRTLFSKWGTGVASRATIAKEYAITRRTLTRWLTPIAEESLQLPPSPVPPGSILLCDGVHIDGRYGVFLLIRTIDQPVSCTEAAWESSTTWGQAFVSLDEPLALVGDGQKGMIKAIRATWPHIRFQRCLVHVHRLCLLRISRHPSTAAGQELYVLISTLFTVWTRRQKRRWIRRFYRWQQKHETVINEKLSLTYPSGRRGWRYAHSRLHAARSLLRNALPHMFTYVGHWEIPRTTNYCEGGLNAPIKELLHRHRGASLPTKKAIVYRYLLKRMKKPPRNVP